MKKLITFSLLLVSPSLLAQSATKAFVEDVTKINQKIAEQEVDAHVKSGGKTPLAGEHVAALMPSVKVDETNTCAEEEEPKGTHYEVIFVAQGNTQQSSSTTMASPGKGHTEFANKLIEFAGKSTLSEAELAKEMAGKIKSKYASDEDRFNALAAFAGRLNQNYNDARNPGFNNSKKNPDNKPLPGGDLTLNQITKAAFDWSKFDGGVCNDISEATAMIAEHIFPDKDVLMINSGSHHGLVVSDGKTNRIINYTNQSTQENQLVLDPKFTSTNMRISKLDNGHMKEIAIVDTQTGQMMENAFQTGKPLLKTNVDVSSFVAHFKLVHVGDEKQKHEVTAGLGVGGLEQGKMYVVVAKYEYNSSRWRNYVGVGASAMDPSNGTPMTYQLHLRLGTELGLIRYATPKLQVNLTTGLHAEGMYGFQPAMAEFGGAVDAGGTLELVNRFDATYNPTPRLKFSTNLELRHAVGPSSWGNATGSWAGGTWSGITGTLDNMSLHLNQFNASVNAEQKVSGSVTTFQEVKYQGSNIGQTLTGIGGVNISAPKGVQILVFSGHSTTKLPGYQTQHSLLVGPNGMMFGAGLQTASGIAFTGTVNNITAGAPPVFQAGVSVPLGVPPKKYKKASP